VQRAPRGPGLYFHLPCLDRSAVVDLRTKTFTTARQEVRRLVMQHHWCI
jgi:hypothetical protein